MRTIAILNQNNENNIKQIIDAFKSISSYDKIVVFTKDASKVKDDIAYEDVIVVEALEDYDLDTTPKFRNWVTRYAKKNYGGYLHVIDETIEVLKDPTQFMDDVENMMSTLDINCYFGTITDVCNRVYNKYNPRLNISLDADQFKNFKFGSSLLFCSHSNIQWVVYNLDLADDNELYFDEQFTIDMFFIIEFLARRRNSHPGSLYYMNQYATCESELGLYKFKDSSEKPQRNDMQQKMKEEDALFKSKNINYAPDNNIDVILENVYMKLNSKTGTIST